MDSRTQNASSTWEWTPRDVDFYYDILDGKRLPLPPSTIIQGHHAPLRDAPSEGIFPDLRGRSLQEVEEEAYRIKKDIRFNSFEEFDRCLDSFNVLYGRGCSKLKTRREKCVCICKFGGTVRGPRRAWRNDVDGSPL